MSLYDFRSVFMPYCLHKQPDGRYIVLNREYKPIGFFTRAHVKYEEYPIAVFLEGINSAMAAKLSPEGDTDTDDIFLYNDRCVPTDNAANMNRYLSKLKLLAKLKIKNA